MKKSAKPMSVLLIASFVLTFLLAAVILFTPFGLPAVNAATNGFGAFDFRFSYTADNVMTVLSHYNGDRTAELTRYYILDFAFALFLGMFTVMLPTVFYIKDSRHYLLFRASAFSGVMTFVFNVIENILLLRILNVTPFFTEGDADIASGITSLKWVFAGVWLCSVIMFIAATMLFGSDKVSGRARK